MIPDLPPSSADAAEEAGVVGRFPCPSSTSSSSFRRSFRSSHARLSSCTTSRIPILRTSALVTPKTRQAKSFAAMMVHGGFASVVKMAWAAGTHRFVWPWTEAPRALARFEEPPGV